MQCYTELIAPSAVTHAASLPLLGPGADCLVVAKTSLLQVFAVEPAPVTVPERANGTSTPPPRPQSRLTLIGEAPLSGTVTALAPVQASNTKAGGAALLVASKDAKLSLVQWDPENHRISTISIHYYEGESILHQPFGPGLKEGGNILTVDPSSRCAALKFGARALAILPFRHAGDELGEEAEGDVGDVELAPASLKQSTSHMEVDGETQQQSPYMQSFVLPLTRLDPALTQPVHLAFLHEYREPTLGILSGSQQPSSALLDVRKDCLSYTVLTLDLAEKACTNLISVTKLPSDLWKVVPLPLPIGGALLLGTNELVHVDQNGKANAVAVNEFAKKASSFGMADQSELNMKLEGSEISDLDSASGDLLITLNDGSLATVTFRLLGRNVSGLTVSKIAAEHGGQLHRSAPSCVAVLSSQKLFIGSEDGRSTLLGWTREGAGISRKRSHAQMLGQETVVEENEDADEIDDDDLYAPSADAVKRTASSPTLTDADSAVYYKFEMHDELRSLGPINSVCFGKSPRASKGHLELVAGVGRGKESQLAFISREIVPEIGPALRSAHIENAWSVRVKRNLGSPSASLLFAYDGATTKIYDIRRSVKNGSTESLAVKSDFDDSEEIERAGTEFERDGETLFVGTLANESRIVQCRRSEIRTYDADLALSQIIPMLDEETDAELDIVSTSFCDPYLLVLRNDRSVQIMQVDRSGDVEPLDANDAIKERKWLSACLHASTPLTGGDAAAFLVSEGGALHVLSLPGLKPVYTLPTLPFLPPVLFAEQPLRRGGRADITELLVADLGPDELQRPYLVIRDSLDGLTLYEPFHYDSATGGVGYSSSFTNLRFRKVPITYVPKYDDKFDPEENRRAAPLLSVKVGRRHAIYIPGSSPRFIVKEATTPPRVIDLRVSGAVKAISPLNWSEPENEARFLLIDRDGKGRNYRIAANTTFETGWSVQAITLPQPPEEVRHVAYHEERGVYVVATCHEVDFLFSEDDNRHETQDDISLRPQTPQYTIHLVSARTHHIIQSLQWEQPRDIVTSLKVMPLEVSEHTHEQKPMVVVGTAAMRGEDMPAKGTVTVFDIIDVVPDPSRPESGIRLHVFSREETKGAITALEAFPFGLIGTAQGMKIMIRGLKEDGSCLPVAFLDAQCYTTELKAFGHSGLWLAGDAWKGLWFGGFTEEPYRLTTLGKSRTHMEVMTAEFAPFEGQLFLLVADAEMDLHVLQYDPENPKSMSGQRLLRKSTFHLGHFPTSMTLLPSSLAPPSTPPASNGHADGDVDLHGARGPSAPTLHHILTTFASGAVGLITPLDEHIYRRLSQLQAHLTSILEHAAGLNPRAYRAVESDAFGGRGVVDGSLVQRISELGHARKAEVLDRAGTDVWTMGSDLEIIGGGGLGYV